METMGRQAEVEARAWRPEVKLEESHTKAELETEKSAAKQETWGLAEPVATKETLGWAGTAATKETWGWTEPIAHEEDRSLDRH